MRRTLIVFMAIALSGCISAFIDHSAGKYKKTFHREATRSTIQKDVGYPSKQYFPNSSSSEPRYTAKTYFSYDVFDVSGKIHKPGDGAAQATVNAVTLGLGELILIPTTIIKVAGESLEKHTLVVFYDQEEKYLEHQLFDSSGKRVSTSGY